MGCAPGAVLIALGTIFGTGIGLAVKAFDRAETMRGDIAKLERQKTTAETESKQAQASLLEAQTKLPGERAPQLATRKGQLAHHC
jgi:hypothetical protein